MFKIATKEKLLKLEINKEVLKKENYNYELENENLKSTILILACELNKIKDKIEIQKITTSEWINRYETAMNETTQVELLLSDLKKENKQQREIIELLKKEKAHLEINLEEIQEQHYSFIQKQEDEKQQEEKLIEEN